MLLLEFPGVSYEPVVLGPLGPSLVFSWVYKDSAFGAKNG